jgi:hypothetical protein
MWDFDTPEPAADPGHTPPSLEVVIATGIAWMTKHKETDSSTKDMWKMVRAICGTRIDLYKLAKHALKAHLAGTLELIDVCVNDCMMYHDCEHPTLRAIKDAEGIPLYYNNEQREFCRHCTEVRRLPPTKEGEKGKPRKTLYYFPLAAYFRDLYARPELVPHLANDHDPSNYPEGSLQRSKRWREKVTDNPAMNGDNRNQAIIGASDGVPLFRDKFARSGWPAVVRSANLPTGLWNNNAMAHMVGYIASDYKTEDKETKEVETVHRCVSLPRLSRFLGPCLSLFLSFSLAYMRIHTTHTHMSMFSSLYTGNRTPCSA